MSITSLHSNLWISNGLNNLRLNGLSTEQAMARLTSGLRINSASDDPSGVAISRGMRARLGGIQTAVQNTQDALNLLRTADDAVTEVTQMVQRIRELTIKGANEALLTDRDRAAIQTEIDALNLAINQVGMAVRFNSKPITSSYSEFNTIPEANIAVNHAWAGPAPPAVPGDAEYDAMVDYVMSTIQDSIYKVYGMIGLAPDPAATLTVTFTNIDGAGNVLATGGGAPGNMVMNIDVNDFLDPDGPGPLKPAVSSDPATAAFSVEMIIAHEMTHAVVMENGGGFGSAWGQEMLATYVSGEGDLRISGNEGAVLGAIAGPLTNAPATSAEYAELYLAAVFINRFYGAGMLHDLVKEVATGVDWNQAILNKFGADFNNNFAAFAWAVDVFSGKYINGGLDNSVDKSGIGWTNTFPIHGSNHQWTVQVGPDSGTHIKVATFWLAVGAGDYLTYVSVADARRAADSIDTVDRAISMIGTYASALGMQERKLERIIGHLETGYVNLSAANSRILDADMAGEISALAKSQIMNQAAVSVVAQANMSPGIISDLLDMNV